MRRKILKSHDEKENSTLLYKIVSGLSGSWCESFLSVPVKSTLTKRTIGEGWVALSYSSRLEFIIKGESEVTAHPQGRAGGE